MATSAISRLSWISKLRQARIHLQTADRQLRLSIVGIGQDLRGDDAAGLAVVRGLQAHVDEAHPARWPWLQLIEAGPAPENYTSVVRRFRPDLVLLVDAAEMNALPGAVRWLHSQDLAGLSASTHTLPLHVLAHYLAVELGCEVALLGIQPLTNGVGDPLSSVIRQAVQATVRVILAECQAAAGPRMRTPASI